MVLETITQGILRNKHHFYNVIIVHLGDAKNVRKKITNRYVGNRKSIRVLEKEMTSKYKEQISKRAKKESRHEPPPKPIYQVLKRIDFLFREGENIDWKARSAILKMGKVASDALDIFTKSNSQKIESGHQFCLPSGSEPDIVSAGGNAVGVSSNNILSTLNQYPQNNHGMISLPSLVSDIHPTHIVDPPGSHPYVPSQYQTVRVPDFMTRPLTLLPHSFYRIGTDPTRYRYPTNPTSVKMTNPHSLNNNQGVPNSILQRTITDSNQITTSNVQNLRTYPFTPQLTNMNTSNISMINSTGIRNNLQSVQESINHSNNTIPYLSNFSPSPRILQVPNNHDTDNFQGSRMNVSRVIN